MAKKTWQERLSQTIAFIEKQGAVGMRKPEWDVVIAALKDWNKNGPINDRQTVSGLMSFDKDKTGRASDKTGRAYKRSAILLACVFRSLTNPDPFKTLSDDIRRKTESPKSSFTNRLWGCYDEAASAPSQAQPFLDSLIRDPKEFLRSHDFVPSTGALGGRQWIYFYLSSGKWKVNNSLTEPTGLVKFQAMVVPPTLFSEALTKDGSLKGTRSKDSQGCTVMLTTQFTGCSFCFSINGNSLVAAHVDPGGGIGRKSDYAGEDVREAMEKHTRFKNDNGGTFKVYGRREFATDGFGYGNYKDGSKKVASHQMVIIGLLRGGGWKLYSQQTFGDHSRSVQRIDN